MGRRRALLAGLTLAGLTATAGCSSNPSPERTEGLMWPVGAPRVRLERVIEIRREPVARRILRSVSGRKSTALFQRPYGMAWDGQDLLVADPAAGRILRIDLLGRRTATSAAFASPIGIAVCGQAIVASDSKTGTIWRLDRELERARKLAVGLDRPTGLACSSQELFVAETGGHRLVALELDDTGSVVSRRSIGHRGDGPGEFNFPTTLALRDHSLWVGDTMNFRVQELDATTGAFVGQFGRLGDAPGDMPRIKGVAVDSQGHLWVSDALTDQISLYRTDGEFLMAFGRTGSAYGEFSFPTGIAAAEGRVAVADSLNHRIQVFRELAGELPTPTTDDELVP